MQDVYILSPVSGLYGTRSDALTHRCLMVVLIIMILPMTPMMALMTVMMTMTLLPREEMGLMSCDDISRYGSQSGSKGSEAVSYYLDQDSGQFFSLLEGDGPPGPDYDRGRNTGVRRRDKTPTHGKTESATGQCEWGLFCKTTCSLSRFSHLRTPPCVFITRLMALLPCVFTSRAHVLKTLITCQTVSQQTLSPAPCLPHHLCHPCPRQLPRHPVPLLGDSQGPNHVQGGGHVTDGNTERVFHGSLTI